MKLLFERRFSIETSEALVFDTKTLSIANGEVDFALDGVSFCFFGDGVAPEQKFGLDALFSFLPLVFSTFTFLFNALAVLFGDLLFSATLFFAE